MIEIWDTGQYQVDGKNESNEPVPVSILHQNLQLCCSRKEEGSTYMPTLMPFPVIPRACSLSTPWKRTSDCEFQKIQDAIP